ncbi:MAG: hypothetical protein QM779_00465 [Propionicimonas sp.]|uniref:hypothetical protein n=1 Tax=Propionicimonas sp. TaxID=1955623 RepID=UPI003D115E53
MSARILVFSSLVVGLVWSGIGATVPAQAATAVTVPTIAPAPVPAGGKVLVKARASVQGEVKIVTKWISVWNSAGTRIVTRKKSAWLAAGTYSVRTVVKYRVRKANGSLSGVLQRQRRQAVEVATTTATCATAQDAERVRIGDTHTIVYWKLYSHGTLDTRGSNYERWKYPLCGSDTQWVWVEFNARGKSRDTAWTE